MELANTIIGAVGDALVLITVIVAVLALKAARGARTDAGEAETAASKARTEAADREIMAQQQAAQFARDAAERDLAAQAQAAKIAEDAADRDALARGREERAAERAESHERKAAWRVLTFQMISDLERRRDRVGRIGQLVEDLFWRIAESDGSQEMRRAEWMPLRNSLRHQLVGLAAALPNCARILDAGTPSTPAHKAARCKPSPAKTATRSTHVAAPSTATAVSTTFPERLTAP